MVKVAASAVGAGGNTGVCSQRAEKGRQTAARQGAWRNMPVRQPVNESRSPSAPLFAGGDGAVAMGRRPAAQRELHSPHAAGRPSVGPRGACGVAALRPPSAASGAALSVGPRGACGVAAHCVRPATGLRRALPLRHPGASGFAGGGGAAAMGRRPAARRELHSPRAAGRPSGGPEGRAGCVAAHCVGGQATRLRRVLPSRLLGASGFPGLVQRFPSGAFP